MKLAWTVATPDTRDKGMLAWRGALPEIFDQLAKLGYGGVDLMVRDPQLLNAAEIEAAANAAGIRVAAVSTGQLRKEDNLALNAADAGAAVERTLAVVDFAAHFGAQTNIGTLRGQLGSDREAEMSRVAATLSTITEHGRKCGVTVAIEPQCRWVGNWLNTAEETIAWMRTWTPEPRILYDVYHALLEERSIFASLIASRAALSYVQLSENNRLPPGRGSLPFRDIVQVLSALQYDGYLCVECRQVPDSAEAARQASAYLLPFIKELQS